MKLELKHLAPYLPYKLRIKTKYGWDTMATLNEYEVNGDHEDSYSYEDHPDEVLEFKPILRPLSDLTDIEVEKLEYGYINSIIEKLKSKEIELIVYEYLVKNHFDVFGLIEKGLAIDINTIK